MAYGTVNADVIQSSVSGVSLGAGNATNFKNRLINGAMVISQRGTSSFSTNSGNNTYTLDRWNAIYGSPNTYTIQQNSGSVTPPAGFINYLGVVSSASSSADIQEIQQAIEGLNIADLGWGTANAKTVTLSFWVRSSLTGTFGGSIRNSAQDYAYVFTYSIPVANTWTQISITIAGPTTGTWLTTNGIGIRVSFSIGMGSTWSTSTVGSWISGDYRSATGAVSVIATNGATWYVTGVQFEVGSSATGFEYRDYGRELQMCQRYANNVIYQLGTNQNIGTAGAIDANNCYGNLSIPQMRAAPTVTVVAGSMQAYGAGQSTSSFVPAAVLNNQVFFGFGGSYTSGRANIMLATGAYCTVLATAEL